MEEGVIGGRSKWRKNLKKKKCQVLTKLPLRIFLRVVSILHDDKSQIEEIGQIEKMIRLFLRPVLIVKMLKKTKHEKVKTREINTSVPHTNATLKNKKPTKKTTTEKTQTRT